MTWFDVVAFILLALIAWVESMRGFGRALFDLVGGIIAVKLVPVIALPLADSTAVMAAKGANQAFWLGLTLVVFGALVVLVARLVYQSTLLSLDYFDPIVGGIFGVMVGLIVVFFFLHALQLTYADTEQGRLLAQSFAGQEVLSLRSYHTAIQALHNLGKLD